MKLGWRATAWFLESQSGPTVTTYTCYIWIYGRYFQPYRCLCHRLGAVFLKADSMYTKHVLVYASRHLSGAEAVRNCSELECSAAVWRIKKFRPLRFGEPFYRSYCQCSSRLAKNQKGSDAKTCSVSTPTWGVLIFFTVLQHSGAWHQNADIISRFPTNISSVVHSAKAQASDFTFHEIASLL